MVTAKLWAKNIAGPVFAIIGLILTILGQFSHDAPLAAKALAWGAWVTLGAAILMVFVAQFQAWEIERQKYEQEAAKNLRPDIRGEAFHFHRYGLVSESRLDGDWTADIQIQFEVYAYNMHPVPTNVRAVALDGSALDDPAEFSDIKLLSPPDALELGIGKSFQVTANATFHKKLADLDRVGLSTLTVALIDAFGGEHALSVRLGETLRL